MLFYFYFIFFSAAYCGKGGPSGRPQQRYGCWVHRVESRTVQAQVEGEEKVWLRMCWFDLPMLWGVGVGLRMDGAHA